MIWVQSLLQRCGLFFCFLLLQSAFAQTNLPTLNVTVSNGAATVSWPATAYYYILQRTTDNLSSSANWHNLVTAAKVVSTYPIPDQPSITTNLVGDQIMTALPVTDSQCFFRLKSPTMIPLFGFAIFYDGLMEFTWTAPMTVRGAVHSNGSIYTGSVADLTFQDAVNAVGEIVKKAWSIYALEQMTGAITYSNGYIAGVSTLTLPVGTNSLREIINPPPDGEAPDSSMGQQRYYNKAQMVIIVSNTTVIAWVKDANSQDGSYTTSNSIPYAQLTSFLSTNQTFTDQRESKTIKTTQIDIGKLAAWAATNATVKSTIGTLGTSTTNGLAPDIVYIADMRTANNSYLPAVRLTNGLVLPSNNGGLTIATPNPLYVQGNYNVGTTSSSYLNTTNTSLSQPASLISDALTVLSSGWNDSKSTSSFKNRDAVNTTINAAIVTGSVESEGANGNDPFSGGVMNLPRLLEDWGSGTVKLTLNTSLVNLYNSAKATGEFQNPGNYYYAPTRDFNFDQNFNDVKKLPPGTPTFRVPIVLHWYSPPPNNVSYDGP